MLPTIKRGTLNSEDRKILRSYRPLQYGGYAVIALLILLGVFLIYYGVFMQPDTYTKIAMPLVGAVFFIALPSYVGYHVLGVKQDENEDLKFGRKEIATGTITQKEIKKRVDTDPYSEPGELLGQINYFHYLILTDLRFMVDRETYKNLDVDDRIEMHYLPSSGLFIKAYKVS